MKKREKGAVVLLWASSIMFTSSVIAGIGRTGTEAVIRAIAAFVFGIIAIALLSKD